MSVKEEILAAIPTPTERLMDELDQRVRGILGQSLYDCQSAEQVANIRRVITNTVRQFDRTYEGRAEVGIGAVNVQDNGNVVNVNLTITVDTYFEKGEEPPVTLKAYFLK